MKDLWKEIVNSLGFAASALLVVIILPMCFFSVMAIFSDPEALTFALAILGIGGVVFYILIQKPTQEDIDDQLWKKEKTVEDNGIRKTKKEKLIETELEYKERVNVRKREHYENLYNSRLRNIFHRGTPYRQAGMYATGLEKVIMDNMFLRDRIYECRLTKEINLELAKDPYKITKMIIDYLIQYKGYKDRDEINANEKLLKSIERCATYGPIAEIYYAAFYGSMYKVEMLLNEDGNYKGYKVHLPFSKNIKYFFDCTTEEEERFFKLAEERVKEGQRIVNEYETKYSYKYKEMLKKRFPNTPTSYLDNDSYWWAYDTWKDE